MRTRAGYNHYRWQGYISWISTFRLEYKASNGLVTNGCRCNYRANSKTATYSIPENLSVTYAGDVVLSTDKQGLMAEVEQMKNTAEKILESVPKQKEVVDKTTVLLSELNPVYKEKKETEQRFSKIEESISRMESTVNNFINSFNHAQGNSNTAQ